MPEGFLEFVLIGFLAQLVDGALGMAYGVTATSVLLSIGVPPATASACVHTAEMFTTGASGAAHWRLKNIDWNLFGRLALPGMVGGALGAYVLTNLDGDVVKPFISAYLLLLGGLILWKAFNGRRPGASQPRHVVPLGLVGGFADAIGGGGWGPIVTSNLLGQGTAPRMAIGTVSLTEFFVTSVISAVFVVTIGISHWWIIAGLVIGGVAAAPIAAYAVRWLPARVIMVVVAVVVIALSLRVLVPALGGPTIF
ncbi:MAG TPA: hypothetical protein DCL54_06545 [Alphaproteobacteria bacterium]|nr:hypothetical protein [Alphaproteobacteria bacterium]HAJ46221.1 hypothetical protein [Alphaproteobacteria bacterium]